ncbi:MAG: hydroxypyruvate isomerase, partial [Paraglaciecola sp.]
MNNPRRNLLKGIILSGAAMSSNVAFSLAANTSKTKLLPLKGRINHSVARWTYAD